VTACDLDAFNAPACRGGCADACNKITAVDTPGVEFIKVQLAPLCDDLHDLFEDASARAARIREQNGMTAAVYNSLGADLTRGLAHRAIEATGGLGQWTLTGDHSRRGQLMIRRGMVRLRFLHDSAGEVPAAGSNAARQAYYRNTPLEPDSMFGVADSNLIAVWRVVDEETGEVGFRVVRTLDPGARRAPHGVASLDLDFSLPRSAPALAGLEFSPADDDELHIDFGDEEGTGHADGDASTGSA
jgi:hypothetical protein